jgi:Family of unknown function (DUF6194)
VTEDEIIAFVSGLPGVAHTVASEANGAPQVSWGDSFFFYDPDGTRQDARRLPFATIVTQDYAGFDTLSNLDRPGVFRLNVDVGRRRFHDLFGHPPVVHPEHADGYDYAALDLVVPHPVYATHGWVSIVGPGERTDQEARSLLEQAHERAANRYHAHDQRLQS